jgi:ParB family transcriptional regulator, chromosome partitioning protein
MKAADRLAQKLGAYIDESMGAPHPAGPGAVAGAEGGAGGAFPTPGAGVVHGGPGRAFPAPGAAVVHGGPDKYQGAARIKDALAIELGRIVPDPNQPRKEFDPEGLAELAASLQARGQLQPIRVRWDQGLGKWVVIAGERRYRAALQAGLPTLACIEAKGALTEDEILEDQLVENCLRQDLKPIEQARAFKALIQRRGCSQRQLAESLHISHQSVVRALALLELPEDLQDRVETGELAPSVAYEVSRLTGPETQRAVVERAIAEGLNRAEVVAEVRQHQANPSAPARPRRERVEFRTTQGTVTVTLASAGAGPEQVEAALKAALKQIRSQGRAA